MRKTGKIYFQRLEKTKVFKNYETGKKIILKIQFSNKIL